MIFRALVKGLLTQEMVDDYDPALMFTIPRLAIVSGLLFYPYMSPLSLDQNATDMSDMFRPFRVSVYYLCRMHSAFLQNVEKVTRSVFYNRTLR